MSNPIKKLAGQTAIYGIPSIVGRFLNYLMVPLYIYKFKQTSDYGVVSELYAWVAFLVVFLTFGMETAFFWRHVSRQSTLAHCWKYDTIHCFFSWSSKR